MACDAAVPAPVPPDVKRSGPPRRKTPLRRGDRQGIDPELRARVFARDGGCVARWFMDRACWGPLDPHHVLPKGRGGPDEEANLLTVCRHHHDLIDLHPIEAKAAGLLR